MPASKSIGAYADVRAVLNQCLQNNGGTLRFATKGRAVAWRYRAYAFLKLYRDTEPRFREKEEIQDKHTGKVTVEPSRQLIGTSPWDSLTMKLQENVIEIVFGAPIEFEFTPRGFAEETEAEKGPPDESELPI